MQEWSWIPWYRARDGFPKLERLADPIGPEGQHTQHTEGTRGPSLICTAIWDRLSGMTMWTPWTTPSVRETADRGRLAGLWRSARPAWSFGDIAALTALVAIILVAVGF